MKQAGILVTVCLLAGLLESSNAVAVTDAPEYSPGEVSSGSAASLSTLDPRLVMQADGAFTGAAGIEGAIDSDGWTLVSDLSSGEPPVLALNGQTISSPRPATPSILAGPVGASVFALAVSGSDLYVGGEFRNVAGIPEADYIARWDGKSWSALGSNGTGNGALNL